VYAVAGARENTARIAQYVIDSVSCILIYLLAFHIFSKRIVGIGAGLMAALYPPFIHSSGDIMTDSPGIFLFLAAIWLFYKGAGKPALGLVVFAGVATAAAMLCRAAFLYSAPFVYAPYLFTSVRDSAWLRRSMRLAAAYMIGIALVLIPRMCVVHALFGQSRIAGAVVRYDSGRTLFSGIQTREGINVDDTESGTETVRRLLHIDNPEPCMSDYVNAYLLFIRQGPIRFLMLLCSKMYLFWKCPYSLFRLPFPFPPELTVRLHQAIVSVGVIGIFLSFYRWPANGILLFPLMYTLSFGLIGGFFSRVVLPAMPFVLICAAWGAYILCAGLAQRGHERMLRKVLPWLLPPLALFCAAGFLTVPMLSLHCRALTAWQCQRIHFSLLCLGFVTLVPLIFSIARAVTGTRLALVSAVLPVVLAISSAYGYALVHPTWHEWKVRLDRPGLVLRQTIPLPRDIGNYRTASLKVFMRGGKGRDYNLDIAVNGKPAWSYRDGLVMDANHPVRLTREDTFYHLYLNYHGMRLDELKQWFTVPLNMDEIANADSLIVDFSLSGNPDATRNYVDVFGDYLSTADPAFYEGPTRAVDYTRTCADKFVMLGDFHVWERAEMSGAARSGMFDGRQWREDDLSPDPGRQTGRYRIFLDLRTAGGI
jgi:4-amino-4-deoxy-L-arabinose transferase-like glycosyltransferase